MPGRGSELATACDLVYVAEDAQIGYPPVRIMSPPDNQYHAWLMGLRPAMEMMLTGDAMSGIEAVRVGFANRAFPADELEAACWRWPSASPRSTRAGADEQAAGAPADGDHGPARGLRDGTDLHALGWSHPASRAYMTKLRQGGRSADRPRRGLGDYRTGAKAAWPDAAPPAAMLKGSPMADHRRTTRPSLGRERPYDPAARPSTWDAFAELVLRNNGIYGGCWCIASTPPISGASAIHAR